MGFIEEISSEDLAQHEADACKEQGNNLFHAKKYDEAVTSYGEAIQHTPSNAILYGNRAAAYLKLEQYDLAISDCNTALALDKSYTKAFLRRGHAYWKQQQFDQALTGKPSNTLTLTHSFLDFQVVLKSKPGDRATISMMEQVKRDQKAHASVETTPVHTLPVSQTKSQDLSYYAEKQKERKTRGEAERTKDMGNDLFKQGSFEQAIHKYTEALNLATETQELPLYTLYNNRAAASIQMKHYDSAILDCSLALSFPEANVATQVKALLRRAFVYEAIEKFKLAYMDMKRVQSLDPSVYAASDAIRRLTPMIQSIYGSWNPQDTTSESQQQEKANEFKDQGNAAFRDGKYEDAIRFYSKAMILTPNDHLLFSNRALAYYQNEQYSFALEDSNSVVRIAPEFVKVSDESFRKEKQSS